MKKITLLICFLVLSQINIYSQSPTLNLQKYWWYRYTLVNDFMTIGENCGDDIIGYKDPNFLYGIPNKPPLSLNTAQAPLQLGYYMQILATEYRLQKNAGLNTERTIQEMYYAIKTIIRLDITGEAHCRDYDITANCQYVLPKSEDDNGFFIRDDVNDDYYNNNKNHYQKSHTCKDITYVTGSGKDFLDNNFMVGHNGQTWSQYYNNNVPKYPEEESQDMVAFVYGGLALIINFLDGTETYNGSYLKEIASNELSKIVMWTGMVPCSYPFTISNPISVINYPNSKTCVYGDHPDEWQTGGQCDKGGAHFIASAIPASIGLYNLGTLYNLTQTNLIANYIGTANLLNYPNTIYQYHKYIASNEVYFPTLYTCYSKTWRNLIGKNVSRKFIIKQSRKWNFRYPSLPLLYRLIHGGDLYKPETDDDEKAYNISYEQLLDKAPSCNPYNWDSHDGVNGIYYDWEWSVMNRMRVDKDDRGATWPEGEFPGFDYMVLFNMYALNTNYLGSINYFNYYYGKEFNYSFPLSNGIGSISNPYKGNFLEYLSSRSKISSKANVEYRCAKKIELLPGFNSETGSIFKAYIKDYECCMEKGSHGNSGIFNSNEDPNLFTMNNEVGETVKQFEIPNDGIEDYNETDEEAQLDSLNLLNELQNSKQDYVLDFLANLKKSNEEVKNAMKIGIVNKKYDVQNNNIFLYPNPSSGLYHIESEINIINVIAYNSLGSRVLCNYNVDSKTISIEGNMKGAYTLQIISNNDSFFRKVILE